MKPISLYSLSLLLFAVIFFSSCGEEVASTYKAKPTAMGKTNQLVIIADQETWDGPIGDTLKYYYSTAYPILPQPEPIFDLKHFTPDKVNKEFLWKELRTYLILGDMSDKNSLTTKLMMKDLGEQKVQRGIDNPKFSTVIGKDKWAFGQKLFYLFGNGPDQLITNLKNSFPTISRKINEFDKEQIDANAYHLGEQNHLVQNKIKEKYGFDIRIPPKYVIALDTTNVLWIREDDRVSVANIVIQKVPYTNKDQLTKEGIKQLRNEFGKTYVSTDAPNSYMRINDIDLPLYTQTTTINDKYALEARGIWEIVNDFVGGAFISFLVLDEAKNEIIYLDGFIHAPGKEKRDYIQRLEHILHTTRF